VITSPEIEKRNADTDAAFNDPQPGDEFSEMFSFWVIVLAVNGDEVVVMEATPPCTLPDDGKVISFATKDDFRSKYSYRSIPGYTVSLNKRGLDVTGWLPAGFHQHHYVEAGDWLRCPCGSTIWDGETP
jgi:hypothetical protein